MDAETRALAGVARGDEAAFAELYELLAPALIAFAYTLTRSREDAEEIVQDTFVRLVDRADTVDPALGGVRAYAYTIVRNLARSRHRRAGARPHVVDVDIGSTTTWAAVDPRPHQEDRLLVGQALAGLEPLDAALVDAAFLVGFSHREVATRFGLPLGTVKSRLRRALIRLRARWSSR